MRAKAFVLINLTAGVAQDVYNRIAKLPHVEIVHAVSGPYIEKIQTIPGVQNTITCNAIFLEN